MGHTAHSIDYYQRGETVIASFRNIGFVYWGTQATTSSARKMGAMSANLLKGHTQISIVQVIADAVALPTDDARKLLFKMTEAGGSSLACLGYVMSGEGFWASTMRSYLTNVHWLRQRSFIVRVVATLEDLAAWMPPVHRERTGVDVPEAELLSQLRECMSAKE